MKKYITVVLSYGCFVGMLISMFYNEQVPVVLFFIVGYFSSAIGSKAKKE